MMKLSLRIRIFLFCLATLGSLSILLVAIWMGFAQLPDPGALSAFFSVRLLSGFGILGLIVFIWTLFDENGSKPIEPLRPACGCARMSSSTTRLI